MADRNLEIALRIKADLESARRQLDELGKSIKTAGDNSKQSADLLGAAGKRIGEMEREAAALNTRLGQTGTAMGGATRSAEALGRSVAQLGSHLASGNISGAARQMTQLGGSMAGTATAAGGLTLGIGLGVAALAAIAVMAVKGALEVDKLRLALLATGNYAGQSSAQLATLAQTIGQSSQAYGAATEAVEKLAASGRVSDTALRDAARGAVAFAQLTGASMDQAVQAVTRLSDDPVKAVRTLDEQYHFLETSTYAQIRALQEQGRETDAAALAQKAFADAMEDRERRDAASLSSIQRAWRELKTELSDVETILKGIGAEDAGAQIRTLEARKRSGVLDAALGSIPFVGGEIIDARNAAIDKQIAALREQAKAEGDAAKAESDHAKTQEAGNKALDQIAAYQKRYADAATRYKNTIEDINRQFDAEIKATPAKTAELEAQRGELLRAAVADYIKHQPREKAPHAPKKENDTAALAAQQQLIKLLSDEQAALDPTVKVWADYNNKVTEANKLADKARTARGADVVAINAERDAVIANAAVARDNALAKLADKDREAWEKLRDSLRSPVEVATDKAIDQLTELNRLFEKLKGTKDEISPEQYGDAVKRIAEKSVTKAPQYQGLDAAVGGIGSELSKNFRAQADLDQWHQEQLKANEAFRAKDTASEEAYQAGLKDIESQYSKQRTIIEKSRGQLVLQTSADLFGQLANLQGSHNARMARVGKAAAIAQAMINTYQSATGAYSAMASIPYVGPVLGAIAAAMAIAAGLANVAQIRAQPVGGYAEGGYTGAGGKYQVAGVVHAGEGVLSQRDMAALGGPAAFASFRRGLHGYADGGYVRPLSDADAPRLSVAAMPRAPLGELGSGNGTAAPRVGVRIVNSIDPALITDTMGGAAGEEVIINTIARNATRVKQSIG